jgi:hypothetical protein
VEEASQRSLPMVGRVESAAGWLARVGSLARAVAGRLSSPPLRRWLAFFFSSFGSIKIVPFCAVWWRWSSRRDDAATKPLGERGRWRGGR